MPGPNIVRRNFRQYDKDNGQAGLLAPTGRGWFFQALALTASRASYVRFVPSRPMTITNIAFVVTTAAGADDAVDVGIYSAALAKIVTAGATTGKLTSIGVKTVSITPTVVVPGTTYYAAFSVGTFGGTAGQTLVAQSGSANAGSWFGTTAGLIEGDFTAASHPLPATLTLSGGTSQPVALALRES